MKSPFSNVLSRNPAWPAMAACVFAAAAAAQGNLPPASALTEFVTPITTGAVRPDGSSEGLWAAGRNYKASFHDGLVFYPHVGPDHPHQPVRWRTTSVQANGIELLPAGAPRPQWSDRRFEYDFGGVVERYDVRLEGLEQSFVIDHRVDGDLVIRGEVNTPLTLGASPSRHGALRLALADGTPVVEYGAAVAIDAAGWRVPVRTSSDGTSISLHVDRSFTADAAYPIVVDPLLSNTLLESGGPIGSVDVLHETLSSSGSQQRTWYVVDRTVAVGDSDLWVMRVATGFGGTPQMAFRAISTWSDSQGSIGLAPGAAPDGVTITAFVTLAPGLPPYISVHGHDVNDFNLRTGIAAVGNVVDSYSRPDVGGRIERGSNVLIVFQVDDSVSGVGVNTDTSAVHAVVWDAEFGVNGQILVPEFTIRNRPNRDQERPIVNQSASGEVWMVTFQENDGGIANDDWDVLLYEVDGAGVSTDTGVEVEEAGNVALHKLGPQISGARGRYLLGYTTQVFEQLAPKPQNTLGELLRVQRVDFDHAANTSTLPHAAVTLRQRTGAVMQLGGMAHDDQSQDHWCVTTRRVNGQVFEAFKLGYHGIAVESGTIMSDPTVTLTVGGVAFNSSLRQFLIAFGADNGTGTGNEIYGTRMLYDTVAPPTTYGFACGTGVMGGLPEMVNEQQIGAQNLTIALQNAQFNGVGYLLIALGRASLPLGVVGAPGCDWLVDPATYFGAIPTVVAGGAAAITLPLPESLPPFTMNFQWLYQVPPQVNALQLLATEGLEVQIGR